MFTRYHLITPIPTTDHRPLTLSPRPSAFKPLTPRPIFKSSSRSFAFISALSYQLPMLPKLPRILTFLTLLTFFQYASLSSILTTSYASYSYGYGYQHPLQPPHERDVLINEFVSRPHSGNPEWIELFNPQILPFDLSECVLEDLTGAIFSFAEGNHIGPQGFVLAELSRSKLNNGGDLVRFLCDDQIIDEVFYGDKSAQEKPSPLPVGFDEALGYLPAPATGHSLGRVEDGQSIWFDLSSPTPVEPNAIINAPPQASIHIQGSGKTEACEKLSFNVTGEDSSDPDGDKLSFAWKYHNDSGQLLFETDRENPLSFTFEKSIGTDFTVQLTVTDPYGETDSEQVHAHLGVCQTSKEVNPQTIDYQLSTSVHITEVFPNPFGKDAGNEFIELFNSGNIPVTLEGWKLNGKALNGSVIEPQKFLIIENISVKNSGDTIELIDPSDQVISTVTYHKAIEGKSYSIDESQNWHWTTPTRAAPNDFPFETEVVYLQADAPLIITQFLPNPDGTDTDREWIELRNRSNEPLTLEGWSLDNREGSSKPFPLAGVLSPNQTLKLFSSKTGITLRNTADQVRILDPNKQVIDQLEWVSDAPSGKVFQRNQLIRDLSIEPEIAEVLRVVDGDTIDVLIDGYEERVRLIGVDTPETVHPFKTLEFFGKEASAFTKRMLEGKTVRLEYDLSKRGKYGRLLAYIWLGDRHFNAELVRQGYAFAYLKFPFKYREEFRLLEKEAKLNKVGMWQSTDIDSIQQEQEEVIDEELEEFEAIEEVLEELQEPEEAEEIVEEPSPIRYDQSHWDQIFLNELLPNPAGKDSEGGEFIELINLSNTSVDLTSWTILNNKQKTLWKPVPSALDSRPLAISHQPLAIKPSSTIKNSSETISLVDPLGTIRDTFNYDQSMKDDQVWSRNPLTKRWQLLGSATPNLPNPPTLLDISNDGDGIADADEQAFGLDPNSWDSDQDGLPDDFELLRDHELIEDDYARYLTQNLHLEHKQTQRTLRFFGTSRPYTRIVMTVLPEQNEVSIPIEADGTWLYKVDIGIEAGGHRFQFLVQDPNGTPASSTAFIDLTLENRLNASKLPKPPKKPKPPKPIYRVIEKPFQEIESAMISLQNGILFLENSMKLELRLSQTTLAELLLQQGDAISYPDNNPQQFELIPRAHAAAETSPATTNQPLQFLILLLAVSLLLTVKAAAGSEGPTA